MPPPFAATRTLPDTLGLLDAQFAELAVGIADGTYAIWLGSGISFDQMPSLLDLAEIVLEHLRQNMSATGTCPYRDSLDRILKLTPLHADDIAAIDLTQPVSTWTQRDLIRRSLVRDYARMMDQAPVGERPDYLLWDAVNVVGQYADPTKAPGVEHLALAALIVEGAAPEIASANWDGLVERAVTHLSGGQAGILQVRVVPAEYRTGAAARSRLHKFHGCAVLAEKDQTTYRDFLVGRQSQLDAWARDHPVIEAQLIRMAVNQPTLMLGLSAQDFNIRRVFVDARSQMTWTFPSHPPAFVFSEDQIGTDQQAVLRNQYPTVYDAQKSQIDDASLLRAFAAHLLPALWMRVVEIKLAALVELAAPGLPAADHLLLKAGLKALRDQAAQDADGVDRRTFIEAALTHVGRALALLREGRLPAPAAGIYGAITGEAVSKIATDANIAAAGLPQFALAIAILGHGHATGAWTCGVSLPAAFGSGALRLQGRRSVEVFFAASARAAAQLVSEGHVDATHDAVVIHSDPIVARAVRSPTRSYPRMTETSKVRAVSVRSLVDDGLDLNGLVQQCRLELRV